jgi:hypothetical protein
MDGCDHASLSLYGDFVNGSAEGSLFAEQTW